MKIGNSTRNSNELDKLFSFIPLFFAVSLILFISSSCSDHGAGKLIKIDGTTMGTTYSIKLISEKDNLKSEDLKSSIDSLLILINSQMSTYIKNSEISLFNTTFDTVWYGVSEDLAIVIYEAKSIGELSGNSYDITIGPVVNLWGFGPEAVPLVVPSEKSIEKAKIRTGIGKVKVDLENSRIKKSIPDLYLDLSSIAKGFGVDRVAEFLEGNDIENYMVEIGGEVRTLGKNDNNKKWRIGISTPVDNKLQKIISISGVSVATSGDYLNYYEKEGVRYSHLIEPETGRPISHNLASVTVIDEKCSTADAFATAINVMGSEKGYNFAIDQKLPVFMIVRDGNSFIEKMTPEFEEYIEKVN